MRKALITGITGQDGSYLSEFLLDKGYEVHGIVRRASTFNTDRIDHLYHDPHDPAARLLLHYGDLTDGSSLRRILEKVEPDEVYNLGAQSHVKVSFEQSGIHGRRRGDGHAAAARGRARSCSHEPASRSGSIRPARRRCSAPPTRRRARPRRSTRAALTR